MNERKFTEMYAKIKRALSEKKADEASSAVGFIQRKRVVTPHRLACSLICALATQKVETIADLHRSFVTLTGRDIEYKPFHDHLAKTSFADFMRLLLCDLLDELVVRTLEPVPHSLLERFDDIWIQDGSSHAVSNSLAEVYPGRFTKIKPAAVELHATMSLFRDGPVRLALAPDVVGERDFLPEPAELVDKLFMGDRGYQDITYFADVDEAGGWLVMRAKGGLNPTVLEADVDGRARPAFIGRKLRDLTSKLKGRDADLEVQWDKRKRLIELRMVLLWNPDKNKHTILLSNLPKAEFRAEYVGNLYRLRWQIELLFKEWRSYGGGHKFNTSKPSIVEGLLWASIAAVLVKRFLAHATSALFDELDVSTRKAAMTMTTHLKDLFRAMLRGHRTRKTRALLRQLVRHLKRYARRAHPKRDRKTGRLSTGLRPIETQASP